MIVEAKTFEHGIFFVNMSSKTQKDVDPGVIMFPQKHLFDPLRQFPKSSFQPYLDLPPPSVLPLVEKVFPEDLKWDQFKLFPRNHTYSFTCCICNRLLIRADYNSELLIDFQCCQEGKKHIEDIFLCHWNQDYTVFNTDDFVMDLSQCVNDNKIKNCYWNALWHQAQRSIRHNQNAETCYPVLSVATNKNVEATRQLSAYPFLERLLEGFIHEKKIEWTKTTPQKKQCHIKLFQCCACGKNLDRNNIDPNYWIEYQHHGHSQFCVDLANAYQNFAERLYWNCDITPIMRTEDILANSVPFTTDNLSSLSNVSMDVCGPILGLGSGSGSSSDSNLDLDSSVHWIDE